MKLLSKMLSVAALCLLAGCLANQPNKSGPSPANTEAVNAEDSKVYQAKSKQNLQTARTNYTRNARKR